MTRTNLPEPKTQKIRPESESEPSGNFVETVKPLAEKRCERRQGG